MHLLIAYPEKAQRELLGILFMQTDLIERLTGIPRGGNPLIRDPENGLFAFAYQSPQSGAVYIYFRASTFGSPKTEYDQIREHISFIHRNPDAQYYALLLREAWFEWGQEYIAHRLELPLKKLGYDNLLPALEATDLNGLPEDLQIETQTYLKYLRKEYEGLLNPTYLSDTRLRLYSTLWYIQRGVQVRLAKRNGYYPLELYIRTQPHVHSIHLNQVFLRQYPVWKVQFDEYELGLWWELEKDGLFLRLWLPPMREKSARVLHNFIRKQIQPIVSEHFSLGRTRSTLKGIDAYHSREVNLLRIEMPEMQRVLYASSMTEFEESVERLADALIRAIGLLPVIEGKLQTTTLPSRLENL